MSYTNKEIVWAKPVGYPWWPAIISKLPDNHNTNFKVLFINEDNYAMMDPKFIRKYDDYYHELSKNKTKKLQNAITKANTLIQNKINSEAKNKKKPSEAKKYAKKHSKPLPNKMENQDQEQLDYEHSQKHPRSLSSKSRLKKNAGKKNLRMEEEVCDKSLEQEQISSQGLSCESEQNEKKKDHSLTPGSHPFLSQQHSMERETHQGIDRHKIDKIQGEVHKIVIEFQTNKIKNWNYEEYFNLFDIDFLTCQELLQSNLTRMIRYIIVKMNELQFPHNSIAKLETISKQMKNRIIQYLSNTSYYDKYLRAFDINKQNQSDAQATICKLIKKQSSSLLTIGNRIKKQNIQIFTELIGQEIGKGSSFRTKEFINDLKAKKYDFSINLTSKVASQRFAEAIINRYV